MKHSFYFYDGYNYKEKVSTRNFTLDDLFEFLTDNQERSINFEEDETNPRKVIIWSEKNIKNSITSEDFGTYEEFLDYTDRYHEYGLKRFAEMPAIRIFRNNYDFLEQQWQEIRKKKPKYLILREHDNGFVDILEKNKLSAEDRAIMEREHKIYLNYVKRWEAYLKSHPNRKTTWHDSADDEYESDFALYDPVDEQGIE